MISIIIPVYNAHEMTRECVDAVRKNTEGYEIIIIDNGSKPPITRMNSASELYCPEIRVIRNEANLGFPVAVNQGVAAAQGDIIVLLNNDVIVTPGWAERFKAHLETFDVVAPVANYCAGLQQEAVLPNYNDIPELFDVSVKWTAENFGKVREVNFVIGFCMAFRKEVWDDIGQMDETHWPCCGEEVDWCFRARVAGYRIAVCCDVYVHHIGSQTFHQMEAKGEVEYYHVCRRNDLHLGKKWGHDFWHRQDVSEVAPPIEEEKQVDKVRLNLGCSSYTIPGFINVDQLPERHPDLVADVRNLPFEPDTVDEIYCGHLLEHLTWDEGQVALKHWHELLKTGGSIMITVPDFDYLATAYLKNPTAQGMRDMNELYIYSYVQKSLHKYCYSPALLKLAMTEAGFGSLEIMPKKHPYYTANVPDQVTYKGVK